MGPLTHNKSPGIQIPAEKIPGGDVIHYHQYIAQTLPPGAQSKSKIPEEQDRI
jgi:hypothetical protein